jgi:hypothetical protein
MGWKGNQIELLLSGHLLSKGHSCIPPPLVVLANRDRYLYSKGTGPPLTVCIGSVPVWAAESAAIGLEMGKVGEK